MAALPAYAYASVPLFLVGLWHAICSCRSYARSPSLFYARTWHPFPRLRRGELITELLAMAGATIYHSIKVFNMPKGSTSQILALQQLLMLLFFLVALFITLISDATLPHDTNFVLLGLAFCIECFVLFKSVSDPELALERESFHILAGLAAMTAVMCFLLVVRPNSLLVSVAFSSSMSLQGSWLLQLGVSLYSDRYLPEGCHRLSNGHTQCDIYASKLHAVTLMDLAFIVHALVMVVVFASIYGAASRGCGYRRNSGYEAMDTNGELDHLQMKPLSTKVVID